MRRSMREEATITLRLPTALEERAQARASHWRRAVITVLVLLGALLLAIGFYLPAKAALAQHLLNRAWAAAQQDHDAIARPWPWADTWPVARLTLPTTATPLTVLAGASGRNLAFAPALLDGSALPGDPGVSVIAGHRDTHFRALEQLTAGDVFTLERPDGASYEYVVTALDIVDSGQAALRLDAPASVVALVTCWPFDAVRAGGPLRYVVTGRPAAVSRDRRDSDRRGRVRSHSDPGRRRPRPTRSCRR